MSDFQEELKDVKREWVGLTFEELNEISDKWKIIYGSYVHDFAKDIELKLREKNT